MMQLQVPLFRLQMELYKNKNISQGSIQERKVYAQK